MVYGALRNCPLAYQPWPAGCADAANTGSFCRCAAESLRPLTSYAQPSDRRAFRERTPKGVAAPGPSARMAKPAGATQVSRVRRRLFGTRGRDRWRYPRLWSASAAMSHLPLLARSGKLGRSFACAGENGKGRQSTNGESRRPGVHTSPRETFRFAGACCRACGNNTRVGSHSDAPPPSASAHRAAACPRVRHAAFAQPHKRLNIAIA